MPTPTPQYNIVLEVAYDGTHYMGWQKTEAGPSIEGALECALSTILQHPVTLQAASRTDRGVHALQQTVHFFTSKTIELQQLKKSLQQLLPDDIAILSIKEVDSAFHPTLDAESKEYHYLICNSEVMLPHLRFTHWHIKSPLNVERMRKTLKLFEGTHDFKTFCNFRKGLSYKTTERTLFRCDLLEEGSILKIVLHGDSFLYKMVRNLVGTAVYVGLGKIALDEVEAIMKSKKRALAGITAPAQGLHLHRIYYR